LKLNLEPPEDDLSSLLPFDRMESARFLIDIMLADVQLCPVLGPLSLSHRCLRGLFIASGIRTMDVLRPIFRGQCNSMAYIVRCIRGVATAKYSLLTVSALSSASVVEQQKAPRGKSGSKQQHGTGQIRKRTYLAT
jgi:hypothetical protein